MELQKDYYSYKPGQSGYTITWYCVDQSGTKEDVTFLVVLVAGLMDSALIFVLSLIAYAAGSIAIRSAGDKKGEQ